MLCCLNCDETQRKASEDASQRLFRSDSEKSINKAQLFTITAVSCPNFRYNSTQGCAEYDVIFRTTGKLTLNNTYYQLRFSELSYLYSRVRTLARQYKITLTTTFPKKKNRFFNDHSNDEFIKKRGEGIEDAFNEALSATDKRFILDISWTIRYWLNDGLGLPLCELVAADFINEKNPDRQFLENPEGCCIKCGHKPEAHGDGEPSIIFDFTETKEIPPSNLKEAGEPGAPPAIMISVSPAQPGEHMPKPPPTAQTARLLKVADDLEKRAEASLRRRKTSRTSSASWRSREKSPPGNSSLSREEQMAQLDQQVISYVADIKEMQVSDAPMESIKEVQDKLDKLRKKIKKLKAREAKRSGVM